MRGLRSLPGVADRSAGGAAQRWCHRSAVVAVVLVVLVSVLLVVGGAHRQPYADARGARLGAGPVFAAYPYAAERRPQAVDAWGFRVRQCTSYVAWYLNSHGVPFARYTEGDAGVGPFRNAGTWDAAAIDAGFVVTGHPVPGSIAQWHPDEQSPGRPAAGDVTLTAGSLGHVAVVLRVLDDGTVITAGYDGGLRRFELVRTRAPRYLCIGAACG